LSQCIETTWCRCNFSQEAYQWPVKGQICYTSYAAV
jgi:hypothetical protein